MKNWIKTLLTICLLAAGASQAWSSGTHFDYLIKTTGNKSFALIIDETDIKDLQIRLEDATGYVLAEESVRSKDSFSKRFDLEHLPNGSYTLFLETSSVLQVQPILIEKNMLFIRDNLAKNIFKPAINYNGSYIDLTLLQLRRANTQVQLLAGNGEILYIEDIHQFGSIQKRFNMKELPAGYYQLIVRTSGQVFHYEVYKS